MTPAEVTDEMVLAFAQPSENGPGNPEAVKRTFVGEDEGPNVLPCTAVVHRATDGETAVVRVPLDLEPDELRRLLKGGQVWLTMFGGLAPFALEVVPAPDDDGFTPNAQKALHQRETEATARALET